MDTQPEPTDLARIAIVLALGILAVTLAVLTSGCVSIPSVQPNPDGSTTVVFPPTSK